MQSHSGVGVSGDRYPVHGVMETYPTQARLEEQIIKERRILIVSKELHMHRGKVQQYVYLKIGFKLIKCMYRTSIDLLGGTYTLVMGSRYMNV